jgi:teichuronic acid biosynthesis glycosyltransferase TuaC
LKLLFCSNLFPDAAEPWRGLDNATLLQHLTRFHEIRALAIRPALPWSSRKWKAQAAHEGFEPRYVPVPYIPKLGSRWNHRLMGRALREPLRELRQRFPFDAVLGSWLYPDCCALAELCREAGVPLVAIAQGTDAHQYLRMPVRRGIILDKLRYASGVITRSAELARLLAAAGFPQQRLHSVYNGIDSALFRLGDPARARSELCLQQESKVILFVGNFYEVKNPLLLVEAHARLFREKEFGDCRLVMVGGGPLQAKARRLARSLGTRYQISFVGRQDPASVALYMQAADVLAVPSWNEGVPNVILESFASGLPVVASRVGGIPEVHSHDFLGRLYRPGEVSELTDALREMLQAAPERERIREHAGQFSWDRTVDGYDRVLREAVR